MTSCSLTEHSNVLPFLKEDGGKTKQCNKAVYISCSSCIQPSCSLGSSNLRALSLKYPIILEMQLSLNKHMQVFSPRAVDNFSAVKDFQDCFCTAV